MKIALFALSLFLLAFSSSARDVLDTDGNPLRNGGSYYILPAMRGRGGGLTLDQLGKETCPISVVQSRSETDYGIPVRIESPHKIQAITEGLILTLRFTKVPECAADTGETPPQFAVVEELPFGRSVKLSGFHHNEFTGSFRIARRGENAYKLEFCPHSSVTCGDVGVNMDENGVRRLVVGDVNGPVLVMFRKAPQSFANIKLPSQKYY